MKIVVTTLHHTIMKYNYFFHFNPNDCNLNLILSLIYFIVNLLQFFPLYLDLINSNLELKLLNSYFKVEINKIH